MDDLIRCPHCGKDNLPQATRCVHCGEELEAIFRFDGEESLPTPPSQGNEDELPELLRAIHESGGAFGDSDNEDPEEPGQERVEDPQKQVPDWLSKVRERVSKEDDSSGDLVKKSQAQEEVKEQGSSVDGEFDAWIERIREKSRREALARARAREPEQVGEDGVPEWLQRVRDLQPKQEDEITHEVEVGNEDDAQHPPAWEPEWTDEELERLRRGEYDEQEPTQPSPTKPLSLASEEAADDVVDPETLTEPEKEPIEEPFIEQPQPESEEPLNEPVSEAPEEPGSATPDEEVHEDVEAEPAVPEEKALEEPAGLDDVVELPEEGTPGDTASEDVVTLGALAAAAAESGLDLPLEPEAEQEATEQEEPHTPDGEGSSNLLLTRSQRERAELLKALVLEEGRPSLKARSPLPTVGGFARIILALILLVGMSAALIFDSSSQSPIENYQPASIAFAHHLEGLSANDQVLVVLDYQAATSAELGYLSQPALQTIQDQNARSKVITTHPSGLYLAGELGLASEDVNYVPGGTLGLIGLVAQDPIVAGVPGPKSESDISDLNDFEVILLVSDSFESTRGWLEQVMPWKAGTALLVIATQQDLPALMPYYDSGQLAGVLSGIQETGVLRAASAQSGTLGGAFRAYQVGLLVMIMVLMLAMLAKAELDASRSEERDA